MATTLRVPVDRMTRPFRDKVIRKCGKSMEMKEKFFVTYAEPFEVMSRQMAQRFRQGCKLFAMGNGGSLCDALHITVEFNHPIIEKRRAFADYCFIVPYSIHRIQEVHATAVHIVGDLVHMALGEEDVT